MIKEYRKLCKTDVPSVLGWLGLVCSSIPSWLSRINSVVCLASSGPFSCRPPGTCWHYAPLYTRSDGWQQANPAPAQPCSTPPHSQQGGAGEGLMGNEGGKMVGWISLLWQGMRGCDMKTMNSACIPPDFFTLPRVQNFELGEKTELVSTSPAKAEAA